MSAVDAVVVCTPATTHYGVTRRCLLAGKHVLVEKPITTTADDAEALVMLSESTGKILMVGHTFLYNAAVRKVKDYLKRDDGSRVYYLYARRTNLGPIRRDVNALWDLAPHDVSIFNYLLDQRPLWVSAVGARVLRNGHEDVGFVSLGYPDDIVAHIHVSWADPNKVRELVVVCNNQRIVFNDLDTLEPVRVFDKGVAPAEVEAVNFGEYHFLIRDGDITSPGIDVSEPLKNQCSHFIACVSHGGFPLTNASTGLDVVRVMEAIDRSTAQNGVPIELAASNTP
jgi:predicted dehydrogenase